MYIYTHIHTMYIMYIWYIYYVCIYYIYGTGIYIYIKLPFYNPIYICRFDIYIYIYIFNYGRVVIGSLSTSDFRRAHCTP